MHRIAVGELLDRLKLGEPSAAELAAALRSEAEGHGTLTLRAMGEGSAALRALRETIAAMSEAARVLGAAGAICELTELTTEVERAVESASTARAGARRASAVRIARPAELAGLTHDLVIVSRLTERSYDDGRAADEPPRGRCDALRPLHHRAPAT